MIPTATKKPLKKIDMEVVEGKKDLYVSPPLTDEPATLSANNDLSKKSLEDFDGYRITKEKFIEEHETIISVGNAKVAVPGNHTTITGEGKAGKTALTSVIIAGAISKDGIIDGFPDIQVVPNLKGKAVIQFDTEQSEADQQYNLKTILKRANLNETPGFYRSYNIRTLELRSYQEFTNDVCALCSERFNGIHMIIVDGGADYITSVNDEAEANAIVSYFTRLAVQYNCVILLVIHLNENAGKNNDTLPRGHLGRQAVRKGYSQLNITKEGDITQMQVLRARRAGSSDTPLVCYKYSTEKGYHISVDAESISNEKQSEKEMVNRRKAEKIAKKIFAPPNSFTHKDAIIQVMRATGKSNSTAKRYLGDMVGWDLVENDDGYYRIHPKVQMGSNGFK